MKFLKHQSLWALLIGGALLTATACKKDDDDEDVTPTPTPTEERITLSGSITSDRTLTADHKYQLSGFVYVESGVTLTIEPGTVIFGDKVTKATLVIKRGGKIHAVGTPTSPIVFTSGEEAGSRDYGDWGGIIICGRANNNQPGGEALIEGGPDATYGGAGSPNDADDSGMMQYVRIEFPGIPFQPNQEINGLTLGAVGSATTIDHIQVSYSGDDSYEWFGGAVNAKYIVAFRGWDDDFDTDNGFRGKVQFAVSMRDHNIADQSGSNSFESDNDASGSGTSPFTMPVFSNVSVFGPMTESTDAPNTLFKRGAHIRRNSRCNVHNSLIAGFPTGLLVDGSLSEANATNNDLQVRNTIIAGCTSALSVADGSTFDISTWFNTSGYGNSVMS
ncbi:MAG TPA: hypothetical protein VHL57_05680, partial [Flavobacteriales bacterium]|nr:hypothetical protein [Flavobacteriales bacterium]